MRTIEEVHARSLQVLAGALKRPTMFAVDASAAEGFFRGTLWDLLFIDQREADWEDVCNSLVWGCRGVCGQFDRDLLPLEFLAETSSVYAQAAYRLGYFEPARVLALVEWRDARAQLRGAFFRRDWTDGEIVELFGPPSHEVIGGDVRVLCYGSESRRDEWIYFDLSVDLPSSGDDRRMLRDVRLRRSHLLLSPLGRRLRAKLYPVQRLLRALTKHVGPFNHYATCVVSFGAAMHVFPKAGEVNGGTPSLTESTEPEERLTALRRHFPRAHAWWAPEEDAELTRLVGDGWWQSVAWIAKQLQRRPSEVRTRVSELGLSLRGPGAE